MLIQVVAPVLMNRLATTVATFTLAFTDPASIVLPESGNTNAVVELSV